MNPFYREVAERAAHRCEYWRFVKVQFRFQANLVGEVKA